MNTVFKSRLVPVYELEFCEYRTTLSLSVLLSIKVKWHPPSFCPVQLCNVCVQLVGLVLSPRSFSKDCVKCKFFLLFIFNLFFCYKSNLPHYLSKRFRNERSFNNNYKDYTFTKLYKKDKGYKTTLFNKIN